MSESFFIRSLSARSVSGFLIFFRISENPSHASASSHGGSVSICYVALAYSPNACVAWIMYAA
jgi:hypothetical protein